MKVAGMQPTYLPWMGYFGLIESADMFYFLDDVQYEVASWQQRNKIKVPSGDWKWLSVPVVHEHNPKIKDVKINNSTDWQASHWGSIVNSYGKSPYFKVCQNDFKEIYLRDWNNLCEMNIYIIQTLAKMIGINVPKIIRASELEGITGSKTDLILSTLDKLNADECIVTPGSRDYLEVNKFKERGKKLYWFEYQHPIYPQKWGEFIPYLSVIDLLFNTGEDAINYIRQGIKGALKLDEGDLQQDQIGTVV